MDRKRIASVVFFVIIFAAFLGGLAWANISLARHLPGGDDFLVPWLGAHNFLTEQANPYYADAAREAQTMIYGHPAREGEYPYRLDIPFHILLFFFPFGVISDFTLARGLWMLASVMALLGVAFMSQWLAEWKPSRVVFALFLVFILLGLYSLYPLIEGSTTIFLALFFMGALLALRAGMDGLAGMLLALTTYKWEVGGLFMLFVLVWLVSHRRWRAPLVLLMSLVVLSAVTIILLPGWLLPFAGSVVANHRAGYGTTPGAMFRVWWPEYGSKLGWALTLTLLVVLFLEWRAARGREFRHFLWVACLTLTVTPLLGIPTTITGFTVLFLPLALVFAVAGERWPRAGRWGAGLLLLALLGLWYIFWRGADVLDAALFLSLPVFLLIALYWLRWWAIRPPRTWLDQIAVHIDR